MATYTVRSVFQWAPDSSDENSSLYEERMTMWLAASLDEAIALAEKEAKEYEDKEGGISLDFFQGYWMFDDVHLPHQGIEIFSLLRESNLSPREYLDAFFDTGLERQQTDQPAQVNPCNLPENPRII